MAVKKKKRRKRNRYHRGVHVSPKSSGPMNHRSGWELSVMQSFDADPTVEKYEYETVKIPYVSNRVGKVRQYIPDFIVYMVDGRKLMIEVKRVDKLLQANVKKKIAAAEEWCLSNGLEYQVWTNAKIAQIVKELAAICTNES